MRREVTQDTSNVLVSGGAGLPDVGPPEASRSTAFLVVALEPRKPSEALGELRDAVGTEADEKHLVVEKGVRVRSGAADVHRIHDGEKLGSLSVTVDRAMGEIGSDVTYLYFDSVAELLDRAGLSEVYRFLNALTGRMRVQDSVGYFCLPSEVDDERVVGTLEGLFDRRVDDGSDGG
jgi:hypothetical protein